MHINEKEEKDIFAIDKYLSIILKQLQPHIQV